MKAYSVYDEQSLLQLMAGGDEQAFSELFNRHWD
jgi:hypothetical protein